MSAPANGTYGRREVRMVLASGQLGGTPLPRVSLIKSEWLILAIFSSSLIDLDCSAVVLAGHAYMTIDTRSRVLEYDDSAYF